MESSFLLPALFLFVLVIIFKNLMSSFVSKSSPKLPPGPKPWPIIGNIPHVGIKPHVTLANLAKIYGPIMSLKLGTPNMIVASSPDAAREILKTNDRIFSGRCVPKSVPGTKEELDHSSLGWAEECNENWKFLRTLCRAELFSNRALESQANSREKNVARLVNFVGSKEGKGVKISELVLATVFNVLGNAFMSRDFIGLEESGWVRSIIRQIIEVDATPNLSEFYPFLSKFDLQGIRRKEAVLLSKMCALWEPIVEERRKRRNNSSSRHHQDFLDTLLDNDFSNKKIKRLFTELFGAGTDTTSGTIEWTMAELLRKPAAMKNVRLEIDTRINEDFPKNSKEIHLPYLDACIKETLRLHPPAPLLLPHRATETCQIMGYTIPKNAQVAVNFWAIEHDASIWDDPLEFKPERFLTSTLDFKGNDFEFLPFSAGRRICPGLPVAAKTIPLILASLLHSFEWSLPHGNDPKGINMNEKFGIAMPMEHALVLVPTARKNY